MALQSYPRALALWAEREPAAVAAVFDTEPQQVRTREELVRRARRLARVYAECGVGRGDRVALALPNGLELLEACLATWMLGATPQPVSHRLPERERRALLEVAEPALVVGADPEGAGDRPTLPAGFEPGPGVSDAPLPDRVSPEVRAMHSGGSTGRPKVIVETAPALCDPDVPENGMRAGGTTLVAGPLYHAGPFITCWQQLLCGGRVVVMARFDPARALALIERHRVDWALFVPTMMQRIWRLPRAEREGRDLSSLRRVMCTGAPSAAWLKRAWIDWLGPERIWEAYGASERVAGTRISGTEWLERPGSVGRPTGGRGIRVLREDGSPCPPGEAGEVFLRPAEGAGSTFRYLGAEPATDPAGWMSLGDMGWMDADGYLYLVDRKTDMILSGGVNVYPAEVEAALDAHPAVRTSAVIGLPDDDLGQRVHAIVDAMEPLDAATLRAHLREHLAPPKIPRSFELVHEPLRDDAGKMRRSALRAARLNRAKGDVPGNRTKGTLLHRTGHTSLGPSGGRDPGAGDVPVSDGTDAPGSGTPVTGADPEGAGR